MGCQNCTPSRSGDELKPVKRNNSQVIPVYNHVSSPSHKARLTLASENLEKLYKKILKPYQFKIVPFSHTNTITTDLSLQDPSHLSRDICSRIQSESKLTGDLLPVNLDSSVFVFLNDSDPTKFKALIAGSAFTPYAHGLFEFEITMNDSMNIPPKVHFNTTGNGKVSFSVTLPSSGIIESSNLNVKPLNPDETEPGPIDITKLLLSIQDLLKVNSAFGIKDESDVPQLAGTEKEREYRAYCNVIKYANIRYAMLNMLQNPPPGLEDFVQAYFCLKRDLILRDCKRWLAEAQIDNGMYDGVVKSENSALSNKLRNGAYFVRFNKLLQKLELKLANIKLNEDNSAGLDEYNRRTLKDSSNSLVTL